MSVANVHPELLKLLNAKLPALSTITEVVSLSDSESEIRYKGIDGKEVVNRVAKVAPSVGDGNRIYRVNAKQDDFVCDVIAKYCKTFKLLLVPGVDYTVDDRKVDFGDEEFYTEVVVILPDSPFLFGTLTFIIEREKIDEERKILDPNSPIRRDMYMLFSVPFEVDGDFFVDDALTEEAIAAIEERTEAQGGLQALTIDMLRNGFVHPMGFDGVTQYTSVATGEGTYAIRFKKKS